MTELELLPESTSAWAVAVTDDGMAAGTCHTADDTNRAVLWRDGRITDLGTLGDGWDSEATGLNRHGDVVGWSEFVPGRRGGFHAFLWRDGAMTDLGTLGGDSSRAEAVNDDGAVVGYSRTEHGAHHAFVWRDGVMTDLGTLRGVFQSSQAHDVDNEGRIVGEATVDNMNTVPVMWQDGEMRRLTDRYGVAKAINSLGQVTGSLSTGADSFLWSPNGSPAERSPDESRSELAVFGRIENCMDVAADDIDRRGRVLGHADSWRFFWHDGTFEWLADLLSWQAAVKAVSDNGRYVAGSLVTPPGRPSPAAVWTLP